MFSDKRVPAEAFSTPRSVRRVSRSQLRRQRDCGVLVLRMLDVGCGAGDSLREEMDLAARRGQRVQMVGVDIDQAALEKGRTQFPVFEFAYGRGEELPFEDGSFDVVISRVAMPYMDIPAALREMHRVLRQGGEIRLKLHPLSFTLAELKTELRTGPVVTRVKNLIYRGYVLANGMMLHTGGVTFRFPLARHRCESFQTQAGIRRALQAAGFGEVDVSCWEDRAVWPRAGNCRASGRRTK